jgi:NAD(P)-dependent dehydrogenase (short-subunit alcohol dehydrogenase family)
MEMELTCSCHCQLSNPANYVIATARNPSAAKELQELISKFPKDRAALVQLDVGSPDSIEKAAIEVSKLLPQGLDVLVGNAGVNDQPKATFEELSVLFLPIPN